jgi:hypothetical protein
LQLIIIIIIIISKLSTEEKGLTGCSTE